MIYLLWFLTWCMLMYINTRNKWTVWAYLLFYGPLLLLAVMVYNYI